MKKLPIRENVSGSSVYAYTLPSHKPMLVEPRSAGFSLDTVTVKKGLRR
jgi:hypothetical protein